MKIYFEGDVKGTCPNEPKFQEIYEFVAKPDAPETERREKEIELRKREITCAKLQVMARACHGCEHNPREKHNAEKKAALEPWQYDLDYLSALYDAARMGLIKDLAELDEEEFAMLRVYANAFEAAKMRVMPRLF